MDKAAHHPWTVFDDDPRHVDRFGMLLLLAIAAAITLSLVDLRSEPGDLAAEVGVLAVSVFVGGTLVVGLRSSGVAKRWRVLAETLIGIGIAVSVVVFVINVAGGTADRSLVHGRLSVVWVAVAALVPVVVIRRLARHRIVTRATLLGAVAAYILISLTFCFIFLSVDSYWGPFFVSGVEPTPSFMYFSLVTISTLGYGDLSAASHFGQLVAALEAVLGQVYLVTIVAMIVSGFVSQRRHDAATGEHPNRE
ncbi:MAG: potassium channel family protein [Acidimicrobiia bacterium]